MRRLLIDTARRYTGVTVSPTTMGRLLKRLKVRRGRPKPLAPCPWSESARKTRMAMIHALMVVKARVETEPVPTRIFFAMFVVSRGAGTSECKPQAPIA